LEIKKALHTFHRRIYGFNSLFMALRETVAGHSSRQHIQFAVHEDL